MLETTDKTSSGNNIASSSENNVTKSNIIESPSQLPSTLSSSTSNSISVQNDFVDKVVDNIVGGNNINDTQKKALETSNYNNNHKTSEKLIKTNFPKRTSSAPLEELVYIGSTKSHFLPTKTQPYFPNNGEVNTKITNSTQEAYSINHDDNINENINFTQHQEEHSDHRNTNQRTLNIETNSKNLQVESSSDNKADTFSDDQPVQGSIDFVQSNATIETDLSNNGVYQSAPYTTSNLCARTNNRNGSYNEHNNNNNQYRDSTRGGRNNKGAGRNTQFNHPQGDNNNRGYLGQGIPNDGSYTSNRAFVGMHQGQTPQNNTRMNHNYMNNQSNTNKQQQWPPQYSPGHGGTTNKLPPQQQQQQMHPVMYQNMQQQPQMHMVGMPLSNSVNPNMGGNFPMMNHPGMIPMNISMNQQQAIMLQQQQQQQRFAGVPGQPTIYIQQTPNGSNMISTMHPQGMRYNIAGPDHPNGQSMQSGGGMVNVSNNMQLPQAPPMVMQQQQQQPSGGSGYPMNMIPGSQQAQYLYQTAPDGRIMAYPTMNTQQMHPQMQLMQNNRVPTTLLPNQIPQHHQFPSQLQQQHMSNFQLQQASIKVVSQQEESNKEQTDSVNNVAANEEANPNHDSVDKQDSSTISVDYREQPIVQPHIKKERKVLTYKSKTGATVDLATFRKVSTEALVANTENDESKSQSVYVSIENNQADDCPATQEIISSSFVEETTAGDVASVNERKEEGEEVSDTTTISSSSENIASSNINPNPSPTIPEQPPVLEPEPEVPSFPVYIAPITTSVTVAKSELSTITSIPIDTKTDGNTLSQIMTNLKLNTTKSDSIVANSQSAKSKKSIKRDKFAAADAMMTSANEAFMLSAYIEETIKPVIENTTLTVVSQSSYIIEAPLELIKKSEVESDVVDNWDDVEDVNSIPLIAQVETTTVKRTLRPGGSNMLYNSMRLTQVSMIRYSKQDILNLKPAQKPHSNPLPNMYTNILIGTGDSYAAIGNAVPMNTNRGSPGYQQWPTQQLTHKQHLPYPGGGSSNIDSSDNVASGWKRETSQSSVSNAQQMKGKKGQYYQKENIPMPKKIISDPSEVLITEAIAILNKITPQTFEKLSKSILELNLTDISMLDKLTELIFEKAVQEQHFTHLYAELCMYIHNNSSHWMFYYVVKDLESNLYFWIKEYELSSNVAGPYYTYKECIAGVFLDVPPILNPINASSLEIIETVLTKGTLIRIYKNEKSKEYFLTYLPLNDVPEENRSSDMFVEVSSALSDAKNKNFFRARLLSTCQKEFEISTKNESIYGELELQRVELLKLKSSMPQNDFNSKSVEIEEKQFKLKKRMLGNIRFVGELFKLKIVTTKVILGCISDLIGTNQAWKPLNDQQDVECLCHLMTTVGERLESRSVTTITDTLNEIYDRMKVLSKDKSLNSRMRFAIDEVLILKYNKWQKRREQEGPLKISEIHQKILEEEQKQQYESQQQQYSQHNVRSSSSGLKSKYQIQQQHPAVLQTQHKSILARPKTAQDKKDNGSSENLDKLGRNSDSKSKGGDSTKRNSQSEINSSRQEKSTLSSINSSGRNSKDKMILQFDNKKMISRMKSLLSEYFQINDINEVHICLTESPTDIYGYFILEIIYLYSDTTKSDIMNKMMLLLNDTNILNGLQIAKYEVVSALSICESLKCLVDTSLDSINAPERIATILSLLKSFNIINITQINEIIEVAKQNCLIECLNSPESCEVIFKRFTTELSK